jgi:hypothetical protein
VLGPWQREELEDIIAAEEKRRREYWGTADGAAEAGETAAEDSRQTPADAKAGTGEHDTPRHNSPLDN